MSNELQITNTFPVPANTPDAPGLGMILQRALQPKLSSLPALQVEETLLTAISTAYTIAGQQSDAGTLLIYVDELYRILSEKFPGITLEETKTALRNGVYGEYGEYYGLNPKTFFNFIKSYMYSRERMEAKRAFHNMILPDAKPTPEQLEESNKEFANMLYQDYIDDKLKSDYVPGFMYDFLASTGHINYGPASKRRIYKMAEKAVATLLQKEKTAAVLGEMSKSLLIDGVTETSKAATMAKQIAVLRFFSLCRAFEAEKIF